jgi:hypothetical protein
MKQVLTSLALMGAALTLQAQTQILNYGFETSDQLPGVVDTVNLYDAWKEAGGTFSYQGQPAYEGDNAFSFSSPEAAGAAGGAWERVLRFTNLPLEENKSYRVSFYLQADKEDAQLGVALMRGELNADMPLVCAPTTEDGAAVQQKTTISDFSAGNYVRKTAVFWSPSLEIQKERFNEVKSTGELPDGVFLRLSFLTANTYLLDNVVVEEANIAGVDYAGDAVRVNFGYSTNAAALAKEADGTLVVPVSAFKLTVDGEAVTPESAEIKEDGYLYLFLTEDVYLSEESKVALSYDGSIEGLKYSTTVAPESWTEPNRPVLAFEGEQGYYNDNIEATSVAYEEAELKTSDPEDSSFELAETISEFTAVFNKEVYTTETENNAAPVATLTSDLGFEEALAVKAGQETLSTQITFVRTGTEPLAKAAYTVTIEGVTNAKDVARETPVSFSFEVGKVQVATTTYTELLKVSIPGTPENVIPTGWTVNNEGEIRAAGTSYTGGPRVFNFSAEGDEVDGGLYIRAKKVDADTDPTEGSALYGDLEGSELVIPEGDVELRTSAFMWKGSGSVAVEIRKYEEGKDYADLELVASTTGDVTTTVENNKAASIDPNKIAVRFHSDGGRYLYKAIVNVPAVTGDSWKELMIAGFTIYSYVETEGESSEAEYVFQEKFTTVGDNIVPAAGSGWDVYDAGKLLTKGSNGSGASSRVFVLSATNLPAALYFRMLGTASEYYGVYGNGGDGEPTLELSAVKYQFTYYAVNWKTDLQTLYFQLLDANDVVVYSREDEITANIKDSKNTVVDAQKIEFKFTPSAAGQYKLKFWASGEAMVGNISIMTVGSPATYWKNLLATAVVAAQDEYTLATQDIFAGTTYDALGAAIAKYSDPDMHTPAAYEAAIAEVEGLTKAMSTRRAAVAAYTTNLDAAAAALAAADSTKYAALEAFTDLSSVYDTYKDQTAQQLEDSALIAANTALSEATTLLSNMQSECVGLLTAQLAKLAAQIVKLDETQAENETVLAAGNALTDDQDLAKLLKLKLTSVLYKAMAEGDPFQVYDEEFEQTVADSIDLTGFIQNADLYTTSLKRDGITDLEGLFPGWTVTMLTENQSVAVQFSWSTFSGSATHPVTDAALIGSWGPAMTIAQTLDIVPVGVYSISAGTEDSGDRVTSDADSAIIRSTFQYAQASKSDTMLFRNDNRGTYYDLTRAIFPNVDVPAAEGQQYGSLTPSATIRTYQSICEVDAFKLHITGKLAGFDYAAAAAAIDEEYATGIDRTTLPTEAPVAVRYYNLAGQPMSQAAGLCIKMERYAGGFVVVKKIVVK